MIRELHSDKTREGEFKLEHLWPAYYVRLTFESEKYAPVHIDIPEHVFEDMMHAYRDFNSTTRPDSASGGAA